MATRRSKVFEFVKNQIYPYYDEAADEIIYLKFTQDQGKVKQDETIKFELLEEKLEEKNFYYYVDNGSTEVLVKDVMKTIVHSEPVKKNVAGTKLSTYKISDSEILRIEKIIEQQQEAEDKKKSLEEREEQEKKKEELRQKKIEDAKKEAERIALEKEKKNPNFKRGVHNKNIKDVPSITEQLEGDSSEFQTGCSVKNVDRELIRAGVTGNKELLKKIIENGKEKISSLFTRWAPDNDLNLIEAIFQNNDLEMLKIMLDFQENKEADFEYNDGDENRLRQVSYNSYSNNKYNQYNMFQNQTSQFYNQPPFSYKEGNNALNYDNRQSNQVDDLTLKRLFRIQADQELFDLLRIWPSQSFDDKINNNIGLAVQAGNRNLAFRLINFLNTKRSGWGYNQLHEEALNKDKAEDIYDFKTQSVMKSPISELKVYPVQCACINPNPDILERILTQKDESQFSDEQGKKLTHYAAACTGPGPLKYLVQEKGLNPLDQDNFQNNALHIASELGRAKNIEFILSNDNYYNFSQFNNLSVAAIHLACSSKNSEAVKILLEKKCPIDLETSQGMQPLHIACQHGDLDTVKLLLNHKANINAQDKFGRTPLIYAAMNGNSPIVGYLLKKGADYDQQDKSDNFPIHYACAYGFTEIVDLLYIAGCELNYYNCWNNTALCVALLKGHTKIAEKMLNFDGIDLDCTDDLGQTLLQLDVQQLVQQKNNEATFKRILFLLERGANPNVQDKQGNTALHYLCQNWNYIIQETFVKEDEEYPDEEKFQRKELKLSEDDEIPADAPKLFMKEAQESEFVKEEVKLLEENIKDPIQIQIQKEQLIEQHRLKLIQDKNQEIYKKYEKKFQLDLIEKFLEKEADPSMYNKSWQSPVLQAMNLQGDYSAFKLIMNNIKDKQEVLQNCYQQGLYENILNLLQNRDFTIQQRGIELFKFLVGLDKNKKDNLNEVDDNGQTMILKVIWRYYLVDKNAQRNIDVDNKDYLMRQQVKQKKEKIKQYDDFIQLIRFMVENGADPNFNVQRLLKPRKRLGKNVDNDDDKHKKLYEELVQQNEEQENEMEEEKLEEENEDQMEEEEEDDDKEEQEELERQREEEKKRVQEQKEYSRKYKETQQFSPQGEYNAYFFVVQFKQQYVMELFQLMEEFKVCINKRNIRGQNILQFYLQQNGQVLDYDVLEYIIKRLEQYQYFVQDIEKNTFIHVFLSKTYTLAIENEQNLRPTSMLDNQLQISVENQKEKKEYLEKILKLIFTIENINYLFQIQNRQNQTALMILLGNQSQGENPLFDAMFKVKEVINSITQVQKDNSTCLHYLFGQGRPNVQKLETLLKLGAYKLLKYQVSKLVKKGRGKKAKMIESSSLDTPLHVLIKNNQLRRNVLDLILQYEEGKQSLSLKNSESFTPFQQIVSQGAGVTLLKDLAVKENINDFCSFKFDEGQKEEGDHILSWFLKNYQESEKSIHALTNLIENFGLNINFTHPMDMNDTPYIVQAIKLAKFKFVEVFVKAGQEINFTYKQYNNQMVEVPKQDFYVMEKVLRDVTIPLIHALNQKSEENVELLLKNGADPNYTDTMGRNALHHAINNSNAQANASFEIEKIIISKGAKMVQDTLKRTPLHYCFVKYDQVVENKTKKYQINYDNRHAYQNQRNSVYLQRIDPYETVSSLCKNSDNDKFINTQDKFGKTALHYAALSGSAMCIRYLINKKKAILDINVKDNFGNTPLGLAFLSNNTETAQILIEAGADHSISAFIHREDPYTQTQNSAPPELVTEWDFKQMEEIEDKEKREEERKRLEKLKEQQVDFYERNLYALAIKNNWQAICSLLIEYKYDIRVACETAFMQQKFQLARTLLFQAKHNEITLNADGQNLLHIFAQYYPSNDKRLCKKIYQELVLRKINTSLQDGKGNTPLHYACQSNFVYLAKHLLKEYSNQGVSVNTINKKLQNSLHIAIINNNNQIVQKIFDIVAVKDIQLLQQDCKGKTILHYICKSYVGKSVPEKMEDLYLQLTQKHLVRILGNCDKNIFHLQNNKGKSILHHALKHENEFAMRQFVKYGVDLNQVGDIGARKKQTPLHIAAKLDKKFFSYLVEELGHKQKVDFTLQDDEGNSAFHYAAMYNQLSIFDILSAEKSVFQVDQQNSKGETAVQLAIKNKYEEFYVKLLKLQPNVNLKDSQGNIALHFAACNNDFYAIQLLLDAKSETQVRNKNEYQTPVNVALVRHNYLAAAKIIIDSQHDFSKEYIVEYGSHRELVLKDKHKINAEKVQQLQNNFDGEILLQQQQFIFDIKTEKEVVEGKRRDVYYLVTATVTPLLLHLVHSNILHKNSQLKKSEVDKNLQVEISRIIVNNLKPDTKKQYVPCQQCEYQPEIQKPQGEVLLQKVIELGQKADQIDHTGVRLLNRAIKINSEFLVKLLLENIKDISIYTDEETKRNPIHVCIEPLEYGSFQNIKILNLLIQYKFNVNQTDKNGFNPLDLALLQDQNKMVESLEKNGAKKNKKLGMARGATSVIGTMQWKEDRPNIEKDCDQYLEFIEKKYKIQAVDDVEPHPRIWETGMSQYDSLDVQGDRNGYYNAVMTQVDIKQGQFGVNLFHVMQLVYSSSRRVFFVFSNWGQLGEQGKTESIPFQKKGEAVKHFEQIFQEKTGNSWKKRDQFEKKEGLYNFHQPVERLNYEHRIPVFDFYKIDNGSYGKVKIEKKLKDKDLGKLFQSILNLEKIKKQFRNLKVNQDLFNIDTEVLKDAEGVLNQLQVLREKLTEEMSNLVDADIEEIKQLKEEIGDLSNQYYEYIPELSEKQQVLPFLDKKSLIIKKQQLLKELQNLDTTAKLICGAHGQLHYKNIHPVDYVNSALNLRIQGLENSHAEYKMVQKYIRNTNKDVNIHRIFALERWGEADSISRHKNLTRKLLFYPTQSMNLLSTLHNGVSPYQVSGGTGRYARQFGYGMYFSDSFQNVYQYISNNRWQQFQVELNLEAQQAKEQLFQQQQKLQKEQQLQGDSSDDDDDEDQISDSFISEEEEENSEQEEESSESEQQQPQQQQFGGGLFGFKNAYSAAVRTVEQKQYKYVLLCEVATGNEKKLREYQDVEFLDSEFQSIKGEGKNQPQGEQSLILSNGAKVPIGHVRRVDAEEEKRITKLSKEEREKEENKPIVLDYNQYVVYDPSQVRIRYLVQIQC